MPETIRNGKWLWYDVMKDLEKQGKLKVSINPLTVSAHGCGGSFNDNKFSITWVKDQFLLVTMQHYSEELVTAFETVLEYSPFCKYIHKGHDWPTVEWDKVGPKSRYASLSSNPEVQELKALP